MQTQGAIGNLINRYRAVLKKCRLLNVFGSLAVAGLLVMGGAGAVGAAGTIDWNTPTVTIDSDYASGKVDTGTTATQLTIIDGGKLTATGQIWGGDNTGTLYLDVTMDGGELFLDGSNAQGTAGAALGGALEGKSVTISGGTVTITGNGTTGNAYLGSRNGLTVTGGNISLIDGGLLYGGGAGVNISGGTIDMGENSALWFSDNGVNIIDEGATIDVNGDAYIGTGQNVINRGNVNVSDGKVLTIAAETNTSIGGSFGNTQGEISHEGGTISTAGTIDLKNTPLTVGPNATLETVGSGFVNTDTNSQVTVEGTLKASAESLNNGGAIQGAGSAQLDKANVIITGGDTNTDIRNLVTATDSTQDWSSVAITDDSGFISYSYDGTNPSTASVKSAASVLPNLDGELGDLVTGMIGANLRDTDAAQGGVRFLSRAISPDFGGSVDSRTATIESAARIAAVSAVPQMTWAAQKAASAAVTQRTSLSAPASAGLQAVAADGSVQTGAAAGDAMKNGFAMWIMPLYQSWNAWGLEGGNLDMDVHGGLGGLAVGADYTFDHAFRAGITVNMGGGYAEGSGDFNKTTNEFTFWGLGAYLGWSKDNFGLTADINHTWVYNDVEQDLAASMQMDSLKSDITSRALSAGLRGEYKLETDALDITPHVGVRYTYLTTDKYDVESGNATVLEGDTIHQGIWTFPIGVAFSKDVQMDSGWYVKPALDVAVIPAAGDIKARGDVRFTGVPGSAEMSTQTMDYITYMGQAGLEFGNENVKLGVNYNLQMGAQSTAHGVFGTLRYEF